jgi:uncharacterized metal-binding protein YceD (DUF177 family)
VTPEFSRPIEVRRLGDLHQTVTASPAERAALARRFGFQAVESLEGELHLVRQGETVFAEGRIAARIVQSCAVSGEPLPVTIDEPIALRFVPAATRRADEEIELAAEDCDQIEFSGGSVDLGEAVAQTLALAIDPYATGPDADAARAAHGLLDEERGGAFAALAALRKG